MNIDEILEAHKLWLQSNGKDGVSANLSDADLRRADLSYADLSYADLSGADMTDANLRGADLRWANLRGADLRWANLRRADMTDANLRRADLRWANLSGADLRGAKLPDKTFLIYGEVYPIFIINGECLIAGCQCWRIDKWREFTLEEIEKMDGDNAVKFYPRLLDIIDLYCGLGDRPEWAKAINVSVTSNV